VPGGRVSNVTLVDPLSGGFVTKPFSTFEKRLEGKDAVAFGVGIYHW
jgi:hypothetical protein